MWWLLGLISQKLLHHHFKIRKIAMWARARHRAHRCTRQWVLRATRRCCRLKLFHHGHKVVHRICTRHGSLYLIKASSHLIRGIVARHRAWLFHHCGHIVHISWKTVLWLLHGLSYLQCILELWVARLCGKSCNVIHLKTIRNPSL